MGRRPAPNPAPETDPVFNKWLVETPLVESDPVFLNSPVSSVNEEDVNKIKNLDTVIDQKITESGTKESATIPILSAPPEGAKLGDKYINVDSGVLCYRVCKKFMGIERCEWMYAPVGLQFLEKEVMHPDLLIPCKPANTVGIKPEIKFEGAFSADVANYTDDDKFFSMQIIDDDVDTSQLPHCNTATKAFLVKLSPDVDQTTAPWLPPEFVRRTVNGQNFRWVGNMRVKIYQNVSPMELNIEMIEEQSQSARKDVFNMTGLTAGIYGFMFESVDIDHNRTISEVAPLKIRFVPEELTQ
jgi:hypothetical protein